MDLKLEQFEGPLDLLLHLIKENKMNIFDIEVNQITEQYLAYIHSLQDASLEVASSYLVMASELLELKARMLLPRPKKEEEEEDLEDPRNDLVERLLEYQAYKEITKVLKEKEELRKEIYTKSPESVKNYVDENAKLSSDITLDDLVEAFKKYLERKKESKPLKTKVTTNEISVSSRRLEIKSILRSKPKVSFFELFPVLNKEYVVATFLAILEMAKNKELKITQDKNFDDIICEVRDEK